MFTFNDKVCRLCLLSDSSQLLNIDDGEKGNSISSKIYFTLKCKISKSDNLPKYICRECVSTIEFITAYNTWLHEIVNQATSVQYLLESCNTDQSAQQSLISKSNERNHPKSRQSTLSTQLQSNTSDYPCFYSSLMEKIFLKIQNNQSDITIKLTSSSEQKQTIGQTNSLRIPESSASYCINKNLKETPNNEAKKTCNTPCNEIDDYSFNNSICEQNPSSEDYSATENLPDTKFDLLTSGKELACPECKKVFTKRSLLMRHLMSHRGAIEKYQCQICRRKFISTSEVQRHTRAHMGLKPYKCKLCFRYFSQKNLLDNHMDWHEGKKSHLCEICGKSLSSRPNLKTHIENFHSLERKKLFNCEECGKSFSRKHHLENHSTVHVPVRPYQCTICGLTFKRSSQLQEHEIVHTGKKQYDCTVCKKAFRTKRVLNVHKLLHSGLKPHRCTVCSQTFVRKGGLTVHMKTHSK